MAGRHDWNLPCEVAEQYLKNLNAPQKEYIWFEQSGHEPPEEEPEEFNTRIIEIVKEKTRQFYMKSQATYRRARLHLLTVASMWLTRKIVLKIE